MLQIGEFSKICQVSVKTLHHYDKIGLLTPAEVDRLTGYRYYRTEQIDTMNYIQRLKRYGFSLEEIQNILAISDNNALRNVLRQQKEKLKRKQQEMAIILNELQTHISVFERTGDSMTYQKSYVIEVKNSPSMNILASRGMMGVDEFGKYYGTLFERVPKERVTPTGLNGARYYDEEFNHESSDIEVFIGIKEKDKADVVMEPCECAMTVHHGGYSALSEAYGAVVSWIIENGYEIAGAPFDLYAFIPLSILFGIAMFFAIKAEKIKKENNVYTYKEIVAFSEGKQLDELEKQKEKGKRPYQRWLMALASGVGGSGCLHDPMALSERA